MAPDDFSKALGEDELDFPAADFFVEAHGGGKFLQVAGVQFHADRQTRPTKQIRDARHIALRQTRERARNFRRRYLPDGDGFAVEIFPVARNGFESVADGVAEVQNGAQAGFGLVQPTTSALIAQQRATTSASVFVSSFSSFGKSRSRRANRGAS